MQINKNIIDIKIWRKNRFENMYSSKELFINMYLIELSWCVSGIILEIFCIKSGNTETGYIIPENIDTTIFIKKFTGSACLKYKTNDSAKNDKAKNGIIITINSKKEMQTEESVKAWFPIIWSKKR